MEKYLTYKDISDNQAYELVREEYLPDIKTSGIILRHKKSGARVCLLSNDDENKVFCAAFRTPVENSTGVPHIIEHSVLNGSKNFPSRDPFMQLVKGSLNTFLNAMTYPDKTLYPVASCNDKDFANLMNVYMDAVFYPNIHTKPQAFLQEGWHYELESPEDELKINGVVYSEMKGATSNPDGIAWDEMSAALFPDATYGFSSGGDPAVIPELTYEYYTNFHKTFYHPSNSYIFVYGNCDMADRLRFMDENYLSDFDSIEPHSEIATQPRFGTAEPRRIEKNYPIGEEESLENKTYYAYATLCNAHTDSVEDKALNILANELVTSDSAPVKQALIKAGIGADVYGGLEVDLIESMFCIVAKNAQAEAGEKFYSIIRDTLTEQVKNGINEKALLAAINRQEFKFREANFDRFPRGLSVIGDILVSWIYNEDKPFLNLNTLDDYDALKKHIGTGYYEKLVEKYMLSPDHAILLTLNPEQGLIGKRDAELREKLAAYKASLTEDEVNEIVENTKALRAYQAAPPTEEEMNCIPCLGREDIKAETIPFHNEEREIAGAKAVYHDLNTNGITYARILFDLGRMPHKYVPYLGLLSYVLGRIDTEKRSYGDINIDNKLNTGSLVFSGFTARLYKTVDDYRAMYGAAFSVMPDKVEYAIDTIIEAVTESKFEDTERLRAIISEIISDKQGEIIAAGHMVSMNRAASYFSRAEAYLQDVDGLGFYYFVKDIAENFDARAAEVSANLKKVCEYIFNPDKMLLSLAADEAGYAAFEASLHKLITAFADLDHTSLGAEEEYVPENKREAITIPSAVQYVGRAYSFAEAGLKADGAYSVANNSLNYDFLYQNLRVKGGAYGGGCRLNPDNGVLQFYSYRDPNLANTVKVYGSCGEYLKNASPDEAELTKSIIGTFSPSERPLSPATRALRSFNAYLTGKTYEDVVREREEMISITPEKYLSCADIYDKVNDTDYICVVGSEKAIRDNADMFLSIKSI